MPNNQYDSPIILAPADMRSALAIGRSFARHRISFIPAVTNVKHFACFSRYFRRRLVKVANPRSEPDKFADQILSMAEAQGAAGILPVTDAAVGAMNAVRDRLQSSVCLLAPESKASDAVLDKDKNIRIAGELGIPIPRTIEVESSEGFEAAADELGYPVVLKRISQQQVIPAEISDFTVEVARDANELRKIISRLTKYGVVPQIQKFVVGETHNICCFATRGEIVAAHEFVSFRRGKHEGIARKIVELDSTRMAYAKQMLGAIKWEGVAGVTFLVDEDQGKTWYLETNGRFWASVQGSVNAGWDFPYWAYRYFLYGEMPTPPPISSDPKITCYHTADLAVLVNFLLGGPSPIMVGELKPMSAIWQYLRAFGPGYQADVFQWNDPMPAVVDHGALAVRAWNRIVRGFRNRGRRSIPEV